MKVKYKRIIWMAKKILLVFLWLLIPSALTTYGKYIGISLGAIPAMVLYAPFVYLIYRTMHSGFASAAEKADIAERKELEEVEKKPVKEEVRQDGYGETTNCTELLMGLQSGPKVVKRRSNTVLYYIIVALSCILLLTVLICVEREFSLKEELEDARAEVTQLAEQKRVMAGENRKLIQENKESKEENEFWSINCVLFNPNSRIYHRYGCGSLGEGFRLMWKDAAINRNFTACAKCHPFMFNWD